MNINLSPRAAAKLHLLLYEEKKSGGHSLAVRIIPLTTGCNSLSFALEITEADARMETVSVNGVPFVWRGDEREWLDGVIIDLNPENGKFSIFHPHPPSMPECPFE
ncbi:MULTISPECIES: iron-sulfur cluster biosynthesis family protein [Thermoactinomyces]|jgi:Fe-S cluster assembly iron-binding protein IscA|uniref:Core domain-containing protein n=1 Tax=Thermoactinomyces daqus TaxID=1329516 RepID=A0A7W1XA04_9BACL|nr:MULTISPECIES: iron-sulfur cluster biosynthesis family protein [Thermoactinomyces]MBA4542767.1 hypothetical protein [Thermoactinomyces daqus]MBH8598560.1 hypothetical protein [Thermoactinomyces sp. CICC 10523]MBH8604596.1 hypothetical protein [Thermoactinomyces sp. CICC 10522]MBH8606945.1 hypothetical protein [Thermoactinomyces sp. CICC 10521]